MDTTRSTSVNEAAARLAVASASGRPCRPVRDLIGDDADLAYAVQAAGIAARTSGGARIVGRKVGLTSAAVQAQLGVDQPDFGVLLDVMQVSAGGTVPHGVLLQPRIEAEVAFILSRDLPGWSTDQDVRAAIAHACAALEIVDSRVADWDITFADTVADNGSSGMFVISDSRLAVETTPPVNVEMVMTVDGEVVSTGNGAACLGDPLAALAWLARTAASYGEPLRAGDVVLSGALGPMVHVRPGTTVEAVLSHDGAEVDRVAVSFSPAHATQEHS